MKFHEILHQQLWAPKTVYLAATSLIAFQTPNGNYGPDHMPHILRNCVSEGR